MPWDLILYRTHKGLKGCQHEFMEQNLLIGDREKNLPE